MALVLMNELGAGALAAQTSVYNSAAYPAGDAASSTCDAALFAGDGNGFVLDRTHALGATGSQAAPFLVEFEPSSTLDHEAVLNGIAGVENVQTFSATTFQAYLPVDTAVFTTDFLNTNNVDAVTTLSNGVKVSAAVHALLGGSLTLAQASGSVSIIAETVGGTAPDLDDVVGHYELNGRTIPDCFGVTFDLGGIVVTGTNVTTTVSGTRATYSFPDTTEPQLIAYYLALLANEPEVLFAEPVAQAVTMASDASLSFPQGDAKEVAQGFGVTGACAYLHDRDFTGAGEVVAVIDSGLDTSSTFFFSYDNTILPCSPHSAEACCAQTNNFTCGEVVAEAGCEDTLCTTSTSGLAIQSAAEARRVLSYVQAVDAIATTSDVLNHGTQVTSVVVGSPLQDRFSSCAETVGSADEFAGVANGAKAVFVAIANEENVLEVPTDFGTILQEACYDNNNANVVLTAWGANTGGAADAVSRDIDAFLIANSDAVLVASAGLKDAANGNTALAKNGISVGLFSSEMSAALRPALTVQLSSPIDAATSTVESALDSDEETCFHGDFSGASAAASIVAGQVPLIEEYLKEVGQIFHYDTAGAEVVDNVYTGSSIKAVLVAAANNNGLGETYGNGFGVPVLDKVLPFEEEHQVDLRVEEHTLNAGETRSRTVTVTDTSKPLVVSLAYTDQATSPFAASNGVVNDVRLSLVPPSSTGSSSSPIYPDGDGNGAAANAQKVVIGAPVEGDYVIRVTAEFLSTASANDQTVSVAVSGRFSVESTETLTGQEAGEVTDTPACCPWGTLLPTTSCFPITFLVLILIGIFAAMMLVICVFRAKCKVKDVEGY